MGRTAGGQIVFALAFFAQVTSSLVQTSYFTNLSGELCYWTSSVVYGNATSTRPASSSESTLTSSSTGDQTASSTGRLPSSISAWSSTSDSTSILSTEIQATSTGLPPTSSAFAIQVTIPGLPLERRSEGYVFFIDGVAHLTADSGQAAIFRVLPEGFLLNGNLYIEANQTTGAALLEQHQQPTTNGYLWSFEGTALAYGDTKFLAYSDTRVGVLFEDAPLPQGAVLVVFEPEPLVVPTSSSVSLTPTISTTASRTGTTSGNGPAASTASFISSSSTIVSLNSTSTSAPQLSTQGSSFTSQRSTWPSTISTYLTTSGADGSPTVTTGRSLTTTTEGRSSTGSTDLSTTTSRPSSSLDGTPSTTIFHTGTCGPGNSASCTTLSSRDSSASSRSDSATTSSTTQTLNSSKDPTSSVTRSGVVSSSWTMSTALATSEKVTTSTTDSTSSTSTTRTASSTASGVLTTTTVTTATTTRTTTVSPISSTQSSTTTSTVGPSTLPSAGKRGLCYTNVTTLRLYPPPQPFISWSYNYFSLPNNTDTAASTGTYSPQFRFIPLLFNTAPSLTSIWAANVDHAITHYGTDAIFGFNEPDACFSGFSACMNISTALAGYATHMQPFANRTRIGSVAVTNINGPGQGLEYLAAFLGNATTTPYNLTIDFLNVHWYGCPYDACFDLFTRFVTDAWAVAGARRHPVWVTEFGMDHNFYSQVDVRVFLERAMRWMDHQPWIERYAWFGNFRTRNDQGVAEPQMLLNDDGSALNQLGEAYRSYNAAVLGPPPS